MRTLNVREYPDTLDGMTKRMSVMLYNIRSSHNVGAIFRTADGAGAFEVVLVGYTPLPMDKYGKVNAEISKTALGAEKSMPWRTFKTIGSAMKVLRSEGCRCVSVEQYASATSLEKYKPGRNVAYIFGNEVRGLSKQVCDRSDQVLTIPMYGKKESLNVSVAAGIVLYHNALQSKVLKQ